MIGLSRAIEPRVECHFCGAREHEARLLLTYRGVQFCDACVTLCNSIVRAHLREDDWERLKAFAP